MLRFHERYMYKRIRNQNIYRSECIFEPGPLACGSWHLVVNTILRQSLLHLNLR